MTHYERAIGIGKTRDAGSARKKRKKRRMDATEKCVFKKTSRECCAAKVAEVTGGSSSALDGKMTVCDTEISHDTSQRRCRGWFSSSWPQTHNVPGRSLSNADESSLRFRETLAQHAASQLAELRLECSSAAKWSELKRSQRDDNEALLSSPAGVLWRGSVKPLVRPSQATSVGKIGFLRIFIHVKELSSFIVCM